MTTMSRTLRVHRTTWLADGVVRVDLRDPEGGQLPGWRPGAHVSLHLPNGLVREYSLCSDPDSSDSWSVAVLREPSSRGGSSWVHDRLTAGTLIEVDGPRNDFPLQEARGYVLVAGGIGVTPLLAIARQLAAGSAPWQMLYCGRSSSGMAFLGELRDAAGAALRVHADDERGGPPDLAAELAGAAPGTLVYCCGPEPLIQAVEAALPEGADLRVERFRAPADDGERVAGAAESGSFDVVCAGSGERVRVEPGVAILRALAESGIDVPSSCQEGVCGTCETKVLSGQPEHRDHVLGPAERESGETMMICVSRCRTAEIVLDLP